METNKNEFIFSSDEHHENVNLNKSNHNSNENAESDNGLDFIHTFIAGQKLNDYLNAAIDSAEKVIQENADTDGNNIEDDENDQNQENINPNSRYVLNLFSKKTHKKISYCMFLGLTLTKNKIPTPIGIEIHDQKN